MNVHADSKGESAVLGEPVEEDWPLERSFACQDFDVVPDGYDALPQKDAEENHI